MGVASPLDYIHNMYTRLWQPKCRLSSTEILQYRPRNMCFPRKIVWWCNITLNWQYMDMARKWCHSLQNDSVSSTLHSELNISRKTINFINLTTCMKVHFLATSINTQNECTNFVFKQNVFKTVTCAKHTCHLPTPTSQLPQNFLLLFNILSHFYE